MNKTFVKIMIVLNLFIAAAGTVYAKGWDYTGDATITRASIDPKPTIENWILIVREGSSIYPVHGFLTKSSCLASGVAVLKELAGNGLYVKVICVQQ
jgi:hypothetical protein